MTKAKILFSMVAISSSIAGILAMKAQKKFNGSYFCTAITGSTAYFQTRYSTILPNTTLYCSKGSNASKFSTYKVGVNL